MGPTEEKKVSLAMLYDADGNILWHKGREIAGRNIKEGSGFSKSYIQQAFVDGGVFEEGLLISTDDSHVTESFISLHIKSLIINRIAEDYFLYIDSGTKESFNSTDREIFRIMGELLGDIVLQIQKNETETGGISGTSSAIKNLRNRITTYSLMDEPLLLTGETGTGKTHIAQLIHNYSGRKGKFKIIHTPGIPEGLFESEMFGHKKGAFTDAKTDRTGLVEEAAGGTLFIDEITEVSVSLQAKLLRFIESGKYTRLGESQEREVDVRIVAASNRNLKEAIEEKEFREDLYYRLNVFEIELPPLRKRKEDIEALAQVKIKYLKGKTMGEGFYEAMYEHDWPGNVRELISVLKRCGVHHEDVIYGDDVREIIRSGSKIRDIPTSADEAEIIWAEIKKGKDFWDAVKKPFLARDIKRSEVRALIVRGLEDTRGKYKGLLDIFNLKSKDYHRFMRFLHEQDLLPKES